MKRCMIGFAAAALAATVFGDIASANIVGYASGERTIPANGYYIGTMSFAGVAKDGMIAIKDVLTTTATPGDYDTMETAAPQIQILNEDGETYTRYFFTSDAEDEGGAYVTGWADIDDCLATAEYPIGTGFWYWSRGSESTITLPGQVDNSASKTKDANKGYNLIGNAYPTAIKLTDVICSGMTPGDYDTMETAAPQIQFLDANGETYTRYFYTSDAEDEGGAYVTGWADSDDCIAYDAVAPATAGFWLWNRGETDGKVTIMSPIK